MAKGKEESSQIKDFTSRYPGAQQVDPGKSEWFQFEKVGDELVGEYRGMEPFRNGMKGTMKTKDGLTVFSCATRLRQLLSEIKVGDRVAIVLAGFEPSNEDSPLKIFQVFKTPGR